MRKRYQSLALGTTLAVLLAGVAASAQDFRKNYGIPSGGRVSVKNISGNVKVAGYNIGSIEVVATKVGRDRDLVQVEDLSSADRIELRVKYPESCNCDASVNFDIRVPAGVDYNFDRLASVSGDVEVSGVRGRMRAESVSGNVTIAGVTGIVSASSVSGNVEAQIAGVEGTGEMKFTSVSGNVNVRAPGNANADIEMSSLSGTLSTDFPIEVRVPEHGPGRSAHGRVGTGSNSLRISSVSGKISLSRI